MGILIRLCRRYWYFLCVLACIMPFAFLGFYWRESVDGLRAQRLHAETYDWFSEELANYLLIWAEKDPLAVAEWVSQNVRNFRYCPPEPLIRLELEVPRKDRYGLARDDFSLEEKSLVAILSLACRKDIEGVKLWASNLSSDEIAKTVQPRIALALAEKDEKAAWIWASRLKADSSGKELSLALLIWKESGRNPRETAEKLLCYLDTSKKEELRLLGDCISKWAKKDGIIVLKWLESLNLDEELRGELLAAYAVGFLQKERSSAITWALTFKDWKSELGQNERNMLRSKLIRRMIYALLGTDTEVAYALQHRIRNEANYGEIYWNLIPFRADIDPASALAFVQTMPVSRRQSLMDCITDAWLSKDYAGAVSWLLRLPPGLIRDECLERAFFAWFSKDPEAASLEIKRLSMSYEAKIALGKILNLDAEGRKELEPWIRKLENIPINGDLSVFSRKEKSDLFIFRCTRKTKGANIYQTHGPFASETFLFSGSGRKSPMSFSGLCFESVVKNDYMILLRSCPDVLPVNFFTSYEMRAEIEGKKFADCSVVRFRERADALAIILNPEKNLALAYSLFVQLSEKDPLRSLAIRKLALALVEIEPLLAAELAEMSQPSKICHDDFYMEIFSELLERDPQAALEWALPRFSGIGGRNHMRAMDYLIQLWADKDPESAARWFANLPDKSISEMSASHARVIGHYYATQDLFAAREWAENLYPEPCRLSAIEAVAHTHLDKEFALKWLKTLVLPEEEKVELLERFQRLGN